MLLQAADSLGAMDGRRKIQALVLLGASKKPAPFCEALFRNRTATCQVRKHLGPQREFILVLLGDFSRRYESWRLSRLQRIIEIGANGRNGQIVPTGSR